MKTISDYAELYREAAMNAQPALTIDKVMAGIGIKDAAVQKALATAMLKYLSDNNINQNNFSIKTMQFLAQQTGDKDAIALAMAQQQHADPNAFKDDPVSQPVVTQQTVDANGDGQVTSDEKLALDLADAVSRSWIARQVQSPENSVAAKNVVAGIQKILADLKVTIPAESTLLANVQKNLHAIPNYKLSPYWNKVDQEITGLLAQANKPQTVAPQVQQPVR